MLLRPENESVVVFTMLEYRIAEVKDAHRTGRITTNPEVDLKKATVELLQKEILIGFDNGTLTAVGAGEVVALPHMALDH